MQGVLLGLLVWFWNGLTQVETAAAPSRPSSPALAPAPVEPLTAIAVQQQRELGERLLAAGEPYSALKSLLVAEAHTDATTDYWLALQIGLCYEAAGDLKAASDQYLQVCHRNGSAAQAWLQIAAEQSLARVAARQGDHFLAADIYWNHAFAPIAISQHRPSGTHLHRLGHVLLQASLDENKDPWLDPNSPVLLPPNLQIDEELKRVLKLRDQQASAAPQANANAPISRPYLRVDNLLKIDTTPDAIVMDLEAQEASLMQLIELLSRTSEMEIHMTPRAINTAHGTPVNFEGAGIPLGLILDRLTFVHKLSWFWTEEGIVIASMEELEPAEVKLALRAASQRILSKALLENPTHDLEVRSTFGLGILYFQNREREQAASIFRDLLETNSDAQLRQYCFFNLSKIHELQEQTSLALDSIQQVIQSAAIGPLLSASLLRAGQLQLNAGALERAKESFSRAITVSGDSLHRQLGAANLAATYLLLDQPQLARRVMLETSHLFTTDPLGHWARFLAFHSDYQFQLQRTSSSAATQELANDQLIRLMTSLSKVETVPEIGPQQYLLQAQGWLNIGATTQAQSVVNDVIKEVRSGFLFDELSLVLAASLVKENKYSAARQVLASLDLEAFTQPSRLKFLLQWAWVELELNNDAASHAICQRLLNTQLDEQLLADTLHLLGSIYQHRGEHQLASLCFAGFKPE